MFTLFSAIVGFLTGYAAGKYNDDNLEEILRKLNDKAKELDLDFKQIFLDAFDSLEKTDSDEIKANIIRAIDKIKEKTAEIAGEETIEESIEKIKENVHEIKETLNIDKLNNEDKENE